ncbi:gliding motility-associated C-terminal domain-containing protein [Lutibacter citreus]|uniref:gliding motility-associated C-terminal domain-containing protein n=1 Tax=Lutibacter citreus TaxID=2138210 RepID=UPI000DBE7F50|nr:gliding motility-associated C-terminal domain-containing protein [Lutibacter citreus]
MRDLFFIVIFFVGHFCFAQSAFQNNGNIQIHDNGAIGFHIDLVNNGKFDKNSGSVGFYSLNNFLKVSGSNKAIFNDLEIDVYDNLFLETSLGVSNNLSFITGKVVTPRDDNEISLDFLNHQLYGGEGDYTHVDGYAKIVSEGEFIFPIGDNDSFRPMIIPNQVKNSIYKGAYFKEDPNNPSVFTKSFNTDTKQLILEKINDTEFWDLNGSVETSLILTWNTESNIDQLTSDIESLRVVGWSKATGKWVDLGGEEIKGDIDSGTIKSTSFIPDDYEVLTIGTDHREVQGVTVTESHNFGITPNGDGLNDTFVIEGIEQRPNNTIYIYNRWGTLLYSKKGYDNSWGGVSEHDLTLNKSKGLPVGTYFYFLEFHDEDINWQGWIYLKR